MYIDLAAQKLLAAEKNGQTIAVEIKSFLGKSDMTEFHLALGQFLNYRLALKKEFPDWILSLAIPLDTYQESIPIWQKPRRYSYSPLQQGGLGG